MSTWNAKRNPDTYPSAFHHAQATLGTHIIGEELQKPEALRVQKRFSAFRFCLRRRPAHRLFRYLTEHSTRCRLQAQNDDENGWAVVVTTQKSFLELLETKGFSDGL